MDESIDIFEHLKPQRTEISEDKKFLTIRGFEYFERIEVPQRTNHIRITHSLRKVRHIGTIIICIEKPGVISPEKDGPCFVAWYESYMAADTNLKRLVDYLRFNFRNEHDLVG